MSNNKKMDSQKNVQLWEENRAFFQANTIKGARFIDDAGKIINDYRDDYHDVSVGVDGLRLVEPKKADMPDEISVSVERIWIVCYGQDCIERIRDSVAPIARNISRHIGVDSYSRLGLRVYQFKTVTNLESYVQQLYSRITTPEWQTLVSPPDEVSEMRFQTKFLKRPFFVSMGFQPIKVERPPRAQADFPDNGMVIDIDVGENKDSSKRPLQPAHIATFLKESSEYIRGKAREAIIFLRGLE